MQVEERLVDGVDLRIGHERAERLHDAARHVAVERVVGREHRDLRTGDELLHLVERLSHADAESFGLVRAGDDAAVVVREHHDGAACKVGAKDPLAGDEEVVAVAKPVHGVTGRF